MKGGISESFSVVAPNGNFPEKEGFDKNTFSDSLLYGFIYNICINGKAPPCFRAVPLSSAMLASVPRLGDLAVAAVGRCSCRIIYVHRTMQRPLIKTQQNTKKKKKQ